MAAATAGDATATVERYRGTFLAGLTPSEWGLEIEEWVLETREELAAQVKRAHLTLVEREAASGGFEGAGRHAETAFTLEAAPEPEPEELRRYHLLLVAAELRLADRVRREADEYGIVLGLSPAEARVRLRTAFLGRERQRQRLETLPADAWAWLRGSAGMGKTALLKSLSGTYLQGRAGLPYATLEPLLGDALEQGSEAGLLRRLASASGCWLIDNWEWVDDESQTLLTHLRDLRPALKVIIASRLPPALRVDLELELGPLSERDLADHEGLHLATGGLPSLVGARLRGEPLEDALEARLQAQSEAAAHTYLGLALLDRPDPPLVRRALALGAATMAEVLEELGTAGLVSATGQPQAVQAAREYLDAQPVLASKLALELARELRGVEAFPLFARARLLWDDADVPAVQVAYSAWATELLRRGFAQRAS